MEDIVVFLTRKFLFLRVFSLLIISKKCASQSSLNRQINWYLIHTWSDKGFKGIVLNRALASLHKDRLKFRAAFPSNIAFESWFTTRKQLTRYLAAFYYINWKRQFSLEVKVTLIQGRTQEFFQGGWALIFPQGSVTRWGLKPQILLIKGGWPP